MAHCLSQTLFEYTSEWMRSTDTGVFYDAMHIIIIYRHVKLKTQELLPNYLTGMLGGGGQGCAGDMNCDGN